MFTIGLYDVNITLLGWFVLALFISVFLYGLVHMCYNLMGASARLLDVLYNAAGQQYSNRQSRTASIDGTANATSRTVVETNGVQDIILDTTDVPTDDVDSSRGKRLLTSSDNAMTSVPSVSVLTEEEYLYTPLTLSQRESDSTTTDTQCTTSGTASDETIGPGPFLYGSVDGGVVTLRRQGVETQRSFSGESDCGLKLLTSSSAVEPGTSLGTDNAVGRAECLIQRRSDSNDSRGSKIRGSASDEPTMLSATTTPDLADIDPAVPTTTHIAPDGVVLSGSIGDGSTGVNRRLSFSGEVQNSSVATNE